MRKLFGVVVGLAMVAGNAGAQVATFDDATTGPITTPYLGFNWTNFAVVGVTPAVSDPLDDKPHGTASGSHFALLGRCSGADCTTTIDGSDYPVYSFGSVDAGGDTFTFDGAYFGTFDNSVGNLLITGYLNGGVVFTNHIAPSYTEQFFAGSPERVDSVTFATLYEEQAIADNVYFNGASVPEPSSLALLGTGLFGITAFARQRRSR